MNEFDLHLNFGLNCYEEGNIEQAIKSFTNCIEIDRQNYLSYGYRGLMYYLTNKYRSSIDDLDVAISYNPNVIENYFNRGLAKKELGLYQEAIEDFLFVKNNSDHLLSNSSKMPDLDAEIEDAKKRQNSTFIFSFSDLMNISNDGNDPDLAFNRGKIAEDLKKYQEAINEYSKAISYKVDFVEAYRKRAQCYVMLKKYEEAIADYKRIEQFITNKDSVKIVIGNVYARMSNYDLAFQCYEDALAINPKNELIYYYRGLLKKQLGRNESAFFDFTKCLELKPYDIDTLTERAYVRGEMKDFEGSLLDYDKLIELESQEGLHYYNRGVSYYKMGKIDLALNDFKIAVTLGDKDAEEVLRQISGSKK